MSVWFGDGFNNWYNLSPNVINVLKNGELQSFDVSINNNIILLTNLMSLQQNN